MKIVVVMPFDSAFDVVYQTIKAGVEESLQGTDAICLRVDEDLQASRIIGKINDHLRSADICIADITGLNPNVMWEVGFIEALDKPLIALSQMPFSLPFNINDLAVIPYNAARLDESLRAPLIRAIQQTLSGYGGQRGSLTIAITGSRGIMPHRAAYAVRTLATPFLGPDTIWYCGTNGPIDEAAAAFLLEHHQRVYGIHSQTYHVSPEVRAIFARHGVSLMDVDSTPLPQAFPDLSWRDTYLVCKADLLILIWDGKSANTQHLHEWLTAHSKDHLLGFA